MAKQIYRVVQPQKPEPPTPAELRAKMPKVWDRMTRVPYYMISSNDSPVKPVWCTVVYVNLEHLWYMVKYHGSGFRECVKAIEGNYRKSEPE